MINIIINMNKIIIQDINLLFNFEEFSKEFARMCVASLIDFFLIRLNNIDQEISRFDCVHNFFRFILNDSTFIERNQFDDIICLNDYRNF